MAMPDGMHDRKRRDTLIRLPIGDLAAWHLVVSCGVCRKDRYVEIGQLIERCGKDAKLVTLLPRLRCRERTCRQPPEKVRLRNRYPAQAGGGPLHDVHVAPPMGY